MADKIPARYIGGHTVTLSPFGGPYYDGEGNQLTDLTLKPGDTLMVPAQEVLGQTWMLDPRAQQEPQYLGLGRIVKAEHGGLDYQELLALGYQFHEGRPDFQAIDAATTSPLPKVEGEG